MCHYRFLPMRNKVEKVIEGTKRRASIKPRNKAEAKRFVLSHVRKNPQIKWVIGIDEVGRGPVAGPVTMCAFACSVDVFKKGLTRYFGKKEGDKGSFTDSKKMSHNARTYWDQVIRKRARDSRNIFFTIESRTAGQIDKEGISNSIRKIVIKMLTVCEGENIHYGNTFVVLDGSLSVPDVYSQITVIKGDAHLEPISLASILAKEYRDAYMHRIAKKFPQYGFEKHVGYGTKKHMDAIKRYGISGVHRKSFLNRFILQM